MPRQVEFIHPVPLLPIPPAVNIVEFALALKPAARLRASWKTCLFCIQSLELQTLQASYLPVTACYRSTPSLGAARSSGVSTLRGYVGAVSRKLFTRFILRLRV